MDTVRYFEFDFLWNRLLEKAAPKCYLDVSSPRVVPLLVLEQMKAGEATLVNPDSADLGTTRELFEQCGLATRCAFRGDRVEGLSLPEGSFDLITCISVIEHIPALGDLAAIEKLWELLAPGGTLLLSVPCARSAFEEYLDFDEYHLQEGTEAGYFFGQRFYDEPLLAERIFSITGSPVRTEVYGEKTAGFFFQNRAEKFGNPNYPTWREPYIMGQEFAAYDSVCSLPGCGVVALEFVKPSQAV